MGSKRLKMDILTASEGECPVCCQIPRGKIFNICVNGHYLCEACSTKVTICPECRSSAVKSRNLLAERFLNRIEFPCSWNGCDETMKRGELSDHEDQCDQNPNTVQFCSMFFNGENCKYKFTYNWLREPENCDMFLNHVSDCLSYRFYGTIQYGQRYCLNVKLKDILSMKLFPGNPVHYCFKPMFYRVNVLNMNKVFFLQPLVKVDKLGYKMMSFVSVQLTPETTPIQVKFTINGNPSSRMDSQWGQNSLPSQNWTQRTIGFETFTKLVKQSPNEMEPGIIFPFSLPVPLLFEYYLGDDEKVNLYFTLEPTC